ncbi:MAG: hypothetical protein M0Q49_01880 [Porticoccaceae bacterium]|nr:hypothetical protein [Porticoccaceae bacterium]
MKLTEIQELVAAELNADPWLVEHHVTALAENKADIENEILRAIAAVGISALVVTPEFTATQQDGGTLAGTAAVRIALYEVPATNRTRAGYCTALEAAEHIARLALGWGSTTVESLRQAPVDDEEGGITAELALSMHIIHTREGEETNTEESEA